MAIAQWRHLGETIVVGAGGLAARLGWVAHVCTETVNSSNSLMMMLFMFFAGDVVVLL